jgi:mycothiol synthase
MARVVDDTIVIPSAPRLAGLVFRRFRGDADLPGMAAAMNSVRLADGLEELVDVDGMRNYYANLSNSNLRDDLVIVELGRRVVGYCRVDVNDQTDGSVSIDTIGLLEPDLRGRGIGTALMDWIDGRVRALAPAMPADRDRWVRVFSGDANAFAARLFEARGFRPVRHFYEMVRPDLEEIPEIALPAGFEVRPVGSEDLRRIWEADNAMFRDHWGEVDETEAAYRRFAGDPRLDPSLFVVAFDGDEIASCVLNIVDDEANAKLGRRYGILDSVGTRREYRRRGLARALICRSLKLLRDQGLEGATLGVDADNANRALALYESCGFAVRSSSTDWRRRVDDLLEVSP